MRATTVYQKSNSSDSTLSTRLLRYGGVALAVGGLGFLWYRNSSLKVSNEMKDEDFFKLYFKIQNKLFPELHSISRVNYPKAWATFSQKFPDRPIDFTDPAFLEEISKTVKSVVSQKIPPLVKEELKNSEFPKLCFMIGRWPKRSKIKQWSLSPTSKRLIRTSTL